MAREANSGRQYYIHHPDDGTGGEIVAATQDNDSLPDPGEADGRRLTIPYLRTILRG